MIGSHKRNSMRRQGTRLSDGDVRRLADPAEVIAAIRAAFTRDCSATLRMPVRTCLELAGGALLLVMPCYDSGLEAAGVKLVTVSRSSGVGGAPGLRPSKTAGGGGRGGGSKITSPPPAAHAAGANHPPAPGAARSIGVVDVGQRLPAPH